jgi:hypothetical protein
MGSQYNSLKEALSELGLEPLEIKVFCVVHDMGETTRDEITNQTEEEKASVWGAIRNLEKNHFIEKVKTDIVAPRSVKYRLAANLEEPLKRRLDLSISNMTKEYEKNCKRISRTKQIAAYLLVEKGYGLSEVKTIPKATLNTIEMCNNAKNEIMISTRTFNWLRELDEDSRKKKHFAPPLLPILLNKAEEGVNIRILLADPSILKGNVKNEAKRTAEELGTKSNNKIKVGYYDLNVFRLTIVENRCQVILWSPEPKPYEKTPKYSNDITPAIIYESQDPDVVGKFKQVFDLYWSYWESKRGMH